MFYRRRFGGFEFIAPSTMSSNNPDVNSLFPQFATFSQTLTNLIEVFNQNMTKFDSSFLKNLQFKGLNPISATEVVKIWYNTKGYDSSVSYLNVLNNAFLRNNIGNLNLTPNDYGKIKMKIELKLLKITYKQR